MTKNSIYEVLAALGTSATLLVGCGEAPPVQAPVGGAEVPAAAGVPAQMPTAVPTQMPAATAPPVAMPTAVPTAAPTAAPKAKPAKIKDSKRKVDKSAAGCCGEGTCSPC